jgi:hypothetical protein
MSTYTTQSAIEQRFGVENVSTWATLASTDGSTERTARIATAVAVVSDEFDEILRCVPSMEAKLPISTVPDNVNDKMAIAAGLWLYSFRATDDYAETPGYLPWLKRDLLTWIDEVRNGKRKLDVK